MDETTTAVCQTCDGEFSLAGTRRRKYCSAECGSRRRGESVNVRGVRPSDVEDVDPEQLADLKLAINALLWTHLPSNTTIGRAEEIAVEVYDAIADEWDRCPTLDAKGGAS